MTTTKERHVARLSALLIQVQNNRQKLTHTRAGLGPEAAEPPELAADVASASAVASEPSDPAPAPAERPRFASGTVTRAPSPTHSTHSTTEPALQPSRAGLVSSAPLTPPTSLAAPAARGDAGMVAAPLPAQPFPFERPGPATETGIHEVSAPRVITAEPPRPPARPVAQVVSKQEAAVDATFGVMLKRSLALRPR